MGAGSGRQHFSNGSNAPEKRAPDWPACVALRLVFAPRGESSGHLTLPLEPMTTVDGRRCSRRCRCCWGPIACLKAPQCPVAAADGAEP